MSGRNNNTCLMIFMVVGMVLMMMINTSEAQTGDSIPSCASALTPCYEFLNTNSSTKPSKACCDPIKKTVETQLTCLCNLFYSSVLQTFNITTAQALALSRNCGVTSDLTSCKPGGSAPAPTAGSPPGGDHGAASRVSLTGFSFLLLLASMLFN